VRISKENRCEEFLNTMLKLSQNGVDINDKLVYANLVRIGVSRPGKISEHFEYFKNRFVKVPNINVFVADYWDYFCQFRNEKSNSLSAYNKIKIYIPTSYNTIRDMVSKVFTYLAIENIPHVSKVCSDVRIDDIVIRTDDLKTASEIRNIICNDSDLRNGLMDCNSFAFSDGVLSYAWDGALSYNSVISKIIANYINESKHIKEKVSYDDFVSYVTKFYSNNFIKGQDISNFLDVMGVTCEDEDKDNVIVNYAGVIKIFLASLKSNASIKDFYDNYKVVISDEYYNQISSLINGKKVANEYAVPSLEENMVSEDVRSLWRKNYASLIRKYGLEKALDQIYGFINTGNYRYITRDDGVRQSMMENGMNPRLVSRMIKLEKIEALNNAAYATYEKYDYSQLYVALNNLKLGKYRYFTNDYGSRDMLQNTVLPMDVDGVICDYLLSQGYVIENIQDIYMTYADIIASKAVKKRQR